MMEKLPCGCLMDEQVIDGVNTFIYEACSVDCEYYLYVQSQAKLKNKPITTIDLS